jgi:hypothetical protein
MSVLDREMTKKSYPKQELPYFTQNRIRRLLKKKHITQPQAIAVAKLEAEMGLPKGNEIKLLKEQYDHGTLSKAVVANEVKRGSITADQQDDLIDASRDELESDYENDKLTEADLEAGVKVGSVSLETAKQLVAKEKLSKELRAHKLTKATVEEAYRAGAINKPIAKALWSKASEETGAVAVLKEDFLSGKMTKTELLNDVREGKIGAKTALRMRKTFKAVKAKKRSPGFPYSKRELLDEVRVGAMSANKATGEFAVEKQEGVLPYEKKRFTGEELREMTMRKELTPAQAAAIFDREHDD